MELTIQLLINAFSMLYKAIFKELRDVIERLIKAEICGLTFGLNLIICWGVADFQSWLYRILIRN